MSEPSPKSAGKRGEPTRTRTSAEDAGRNFRNGCLFLVGTVLLLWLLIFLFWTFAPH